MIVIFLDLDGVLNSLRSATAFEHIDVTSTEDPFKPLTKNMNAEITRATIDPVSVALINRLVRESGAKIVVSSSHRLMFMKVFDPVGIKILDLVELRKYIHHQGIEAEVIDATEDFYFSRRKEGAIRGDEIQLWLDKHPEVTNYVIFDDDADMLESQLKHFVHTSTIDGLRYEDYAKARAILKLPSANASVNSMCRTDQEYYTSASYHDGQHVRFTHNGLRGFGIVRGLAFFEAHLQIYTVEDTSGAFPNARYPYKYISVPHSSLSLVKPD